MKKRLPRSVKAPAGPFLERNRRWAAEKQEVIKARREKQENAPQLDCTFTPKIGGPKRGLLRIVDPTEFYARNVKWAQSVAQTTARRVACTFPSAKASPKRVPKCGKDVHKESRKPEAEEVPGWDIAAQIGRRVEYFFGFTDT